MLEEAFEDPLQLLHGILEVSLNGIILLRAVRNERDQIEDFRFLLVNPAAERILRLSADALVGRRLTEYFPNREKALFYKYVNVVETGKPFIGENHFQEGTFDLYFELTAVRYGDGVLITFNDVTEKRKNEVLLREKERFTSEILNDTVQSRQFIRKIADTTPGIITVFNIHTGKYAYINRAIEVITGYTVEEFFEGGTPFARSLMHPDDLAAGMTLPERKALEDSLDPSYDADATYTWEYRVRKKGGGWVWLQTTGMIFSRDDRGRVEQLINVSIDITARKETKLRLRQLNEELQQRVRERTAELERSRQQLTLVINGIPDLISYIDADYRYQYVNQSYNTWFGQDLRHWVGKLMWEVLGEEAFAALKPYAERAMAGEAAMYETFLPYKYGGGRYVRARYIPDKAAEGTVRGMIVLVSDITPTVKAQEESKASAARFRQLFEAIPTLAWTALTDGTITYGNKAWQDYYGLEDPLSWNWQQSVHPDDLPRVLETGHEAIEGKSVFECEYRRIGRSGQARWMLTRSSPVLNSEGEITEWISTATDIHELKQQREALERTNHLLNRINADLDNFIYTASHDLRSPILNIEGLTAMLQHLLAQPAPDLAEAGGILDLVSQSVDRFKRTIQDLSDVAKATQDISEDVQQQDIAELVEEIRHDLEKEIAAAEAQLLLDIGRCSTIKFSRKNLRSILYNLISNAIKYRAAERPPIVEISTACVNSTDMLLRVRDNGSGIPPEYQQKIFSMFTRLHHQVEGSGIGLFLVRRMVENAGGTVEVDSEVGVGSTFTILLRNNR